MTDRNFSEMLRSQWSQSKFVCVGLDSDFAKIPRSCYVSGNECEVSIENTIVAFNSAIVETTYGLVCAYKPNLAFYLRYGDVGIGALQRTIGAIHRMAPEIPVILDAKVADIGNTNEGYVSFAFDYLGADAITVHPYLGAEALQPFLARKDKGVIVLCRTSNQGAAELQDQEIRITDRVKIPFYEYVADRVARHWNTNGNCALVVGATYPRELKRVRKLVGDMPILIPGIGAQGGDVKETVEAGKDSRGQGMIINSSRGIIFASNKEDYDLAARAETLKLHQLINQNR